MYGRVYITHLCIHVQLELFQYLSKYVKSQVFICIRPIPIQHLNSPHFIFVNLSSGSGNFIFNILLICSIPLYVTQLGPGQPRATQFCGHHVVFIDKRECFSSVNLVSIVSAFSFDACKEFFTLSLTFLVVLNKSIVL